MDEPTTERRQIETLLNNLAHLRARLAFIENSVFWKVRERYFAVKARCGFPHDPAPPALPTDVAAETADLDDAYGRWCFEREPMRLEMERMREISRHLAAKPTFEIVVDAAPDSAADRAARAQIYSYGEVTNVAETVGTTPLERFAAAIAKSSADFIVCVDEDRLLAPTATFEFAMAINARPEASIVYGDRDRLADGGERVAPMFLPDWSPETILAHDYIGDVFAIRRSACIAIGGMRRGFGPPAYDLVLRVAETDAPIVHRAAIGYHLKSDAPDLFGDAEPASRAVACALERRGIDARVEIDPLASGVNVVRYRVPAQSEVDIIIPTRDKAHLLERCLTTLFEQNTDVAFTVTIVDNGSTERETARLLETWQSRERERFAIRRIDESFNYARLMNAAVDGTAAPFVLFLNNDTEMISPSAVLALLEYASQAAIGAVGARLLYPGGAIQHVGIALDSLGLPYHPYRGRLSIGENNLELAGVRNWSAVTGACLMVARATFERCGRFDEFYGNDYNDVDLCLRFLERGFRNVVLPHVVLMHHEAISRGVADTATKRQTYDRERKRFLQRWSAMRGRDPYFAEDIERFTTPSVTGKL